MGNMIQPDLFHQILSAIDLSPATFTPAHPVRAKAEAFPEAFAEVSYEGFRNAATYQVALALKNDFALYEWAMKHANDECELNGDLLRKTFDLRRVDEDYPGPWICAKRKIVAVSDRCVGDVDWQEVADFVMSDRREDLESSDGMTDLQLLAACTLEGNVARFTSPLRRETYERLDGALKKLGGKWNRAKRGHVFDRDPAPLIAEAISKGKVTNANTLEFFWTPADLARRMVEIAGIRPEHVVLEPSAGEGAIADEIRAVCPKATLHVGELDSVRIERLLAKGCTLAFSDFLAYRPGQHYDRICMNPPFSAKQDIRHVMHAWSMLKPGGRLVAIMGAGVLSNSHRETAEFREFLAEYGSFEELPAGLFKAAGTMVSTIQVVLDRP